MGKLAVLPLLVAAACLLAGVYGAMHSQVLYTVWPSYFHDLRFEQFRLSPALHGRDGAALVGFLMTWSTGLVLSLPLAVAALFAPGARGTVGAFLRGAACSVAVTLLAGLGGLGLAAATLPAVQDRGLALVGAMSAASYPGVALGALLGLAVVVREVLRRDRALRPTANVDTPPRRS